MASGDYDLTLADSHIVDVELAWRDDIRDAFRLGETVVHGWALRPDEPELLAAVDEFIRSEYRGLFFNMTRNKYFREPRKIRRHVEFRAERQGQISPWDDLTRRYAARYGFDWRLILAQMHQESRFDPNARSFAGAQGLLQVLPRTARELGLTDMSDPETSVHAGVRYLAWNRERFERNLAPDDLNWFALAAYNVGIGHVRDARRIAQQRGWDRNLWFDNVERAMLLKERPEVHRETRFGYARGSEPVAYVRAVRDRYRAYLGVAAPRVSAGPR